MGESGGILGGLGALGMRALAGRPGPAEELARGNGNGSGSDAPPTDQVADPDEPPAAADGDGDGDGDDGSTRAATPDDLPQPTL